MAALLSIDSAPVRLEGISKAFNETIAVHRFDLTAQAGKLTTLLGPSGCGKTTTLRMIAGFFFPDSGDIFIGDERVTEMLPNKRPTRTVFQNYALFPHMTVRENVAFGLNVMRLNRSDIVTRVNEVLAVVGLDGMGDRQPGQLSGGQQQRVALARALVTRPKVLLLDEPLSNLDAKLRIVMREEIRRLQTELGITTIYVTHDQEEALSLSDTIVVMDKGEALQIGTPAEIYERPVNRFVAQFLGVSNFLQGDVVEGAADRTTVRLCEDYVIAVSAAAPLATGARVEVTVRPENLALVADDAPGIAARIVTRSYLGAVARYRLKLTTQDEDVIVDDHAPQGLHLHAPGTAVRVQVRPGRGFVQARA